jgi:hypothetical protein
MTPLLEAALDLQTFFNHRQWRFCIILKLFAFRPRDVLDVETVVVRQRDTLDWEYIERQLEPLAEVKEQPEIMDALARLRR